MHFEPGCRKLSSGPVMTALILSHTRKGISGAISEMFLYRSISPGSILSLRAFLFVLLLLPGMTCHADTSPVGTFTPAELSQRLKEPNPPIIIDVRTRDEYSSGHIDTALNLPHDELERRLGEMPGNKSSEIIVYCRSGKRARITEDLLAEKGYTNIKDLAGHWQVWSSQAK